MGGHQPMAAPRVVGGSKRMNASLAKQALEIVERALDLSISDRPAFVERACAGNTVLRREVDSMLAFDRGISIEPVECPNSGVLAPADKDLSLAKRYELKNELGRGGMGTVYRAHDVLLDREVAVKVVHVNTIHYESARDRFALEARIGAKLQHPGIAPVYDLGRLPDGRVFFAMKLVVGKTLSSLLTARVDPADDRATLIQLFLQLCQTVAYAHSRKVVHRDLKPDNVMVGEFGEVQVMDWGLSTSASLGGDEFSQPPIRNCGGEDHPTAPHIPHSGVIAGTPAYMPPEQVEGRYCQRSDVFSLGAILCEVLTGTPPYAGDSLLEVYEMSREADLAGAYQRLNDCQADSELISLAKQCLQPVSQDRPADASSVAESVANYQRKVEERLRSAEVAAAQAETRSVEERKRRRVFGALIASGFAFVVVTLGSLVWHWGEQARHAEQLTVIQRDKAASLQAQVYRLNMTSAFAEFASQNYIQARRILDSTSTEHRAWEWHYLDGQLDQSFHNFPLPSRALAAAFVRSGDLLLALDKSNTAHVWDTMKSDEVSRSSIKGFAVAMAPNGHWILSCDQHPFLWDGLTGNVIRQFPKWPQPQHMPGHETFVYRRSAISANADHVAFPVDRHLCLFDGQTKKRLKQFRVHRLLSVRFSADGRWLVWTDGMTIHFWDVIAGGVRAGENHLLVGSRSGQSGDFQRQVESGHVES